MKIGLFGDSFGTGIQIHNSLVEPSAMQYHWSTLLKDDMNAELINYCVLGSSVYFSYENFVKHNHRYDLVIFLTTDPDRYPTPIQLSSGRTVHITSLPHIDYIKGNNDVSKFDKEVLTDIEGWFKASTANYNIDITTLMLNNVLNIRPDAIIIPCFHHSFGVQFAKKMKLNSNQCLSEFQKIQMDMMNYQIEDLGTKMEENPDIVSGHLIPEMHQIVFEIVKKRIKDGEWSWDIPKSITLGNQSKDYYISIN